MSQNDLIDFLTPKGSHFLSKNMLEFRVSKLQSHFSKNILFVTCNIFSLLMVICLSWSLHCKHVSLLGFNILSFNIWRLKWKSIRSLHLKSLITIYSEPIYAFFTLILKDLYNFFHIFIFNRRSVFMYKVFYLFHSGWEKVIYHYTKNNDAKNAIL